MSQQKTHRVKCLPGFFESVKSGKKPFEIRFNDRDYREGDTLVLCKYFSHNDSFSGDEISRTITYMTDWDQQSGYVVLGIPDQGEATRLREALKYYADKPCIQENDIGWDVGFLARKALSSSHREDGIQKVRELYEKYVGSDDRKNRGIALGVKLASEALGISIADGGNSDE